MKSGSARVRSEPEWILVASACGLDVKQMAGQVIIRKPGQVTKITQTRSVI